MNELSYCPVVVWQVVMMVLFWCVVNVVVVVGVKNEWWHNIKYYISLLNLRTCVLFMRGFLDHTCHGGGDEIIGGYSSRSLHNFVCLQSISHMTLPYQTDSRGPIIFLYSTVKDWHQCSIRYHHRLGSFSTKSKCWYFSWSRKLTTLFLPTEPRAMRPPGPFPAIYHILFPIFRIIIENTKLRLVRHIGIFHYTFKKSNLPLFKNFEFHIGVQAHTTTTCERIPSPHR